MNDLLNIEREAVVAFSDIKLLKGCRVAVSNIVVKHLLQVCTGSKFPIIFRYYPDISTVKRLLVMMRMTAQRPGPRDCVTDVLRM